MVDGNVQVPADGVGKKLRTVVVDTDKHQEVVTLAAADGTILDQPLTDDELRATSVPVSGPLTDAQLRASGLPVSVAGTVAVSGPLTDAQLRA